MKIQKFHNYLSVNASSKLFNLVLLLLVLIAASCSQDEEKETLFRNPDSSATGIEFSNDLTPTDDLNILDYLYFYNGGGVAVGDINGDDLPDIYLSANQLKNKLYLNKGNHQFEDITETAGVAGNSSWNTGSVMADINNDGLLDIYVCAVVGLNGFRGHNELFINNGDNTFTEKSKDYGLDFDTYSSSAAFLDYDQDGDLDMYLLNHAVHTQESFGDIGLRYKRNDQTGDKLLRNDGGKFVDVSEEAGIFGGINGYGLGISVADFNQDGYPDLYIGNDFHEDDYFYVNNGDGTFSDKLRDYFGHTTRFSMGSDVADLNHDGWPDIISLDMLPQDENVLKASEGDEDIQVQKLRTERYGYHYQYTRNMLFINHQETGFAETAMMSGISSTDWSWSAIFADYNLDGEQDVFVSNGIPKRPNDLDFIKFVSNDQIQKKMSNTSLMDQQALNMMPSGSIPNKVFSGSADLKFTDQSENWISQDTLVSGATAIADFDLDGDLDIITNNINRPATLYINQSKDNSTYLKIKLKYSELNPFGIGTKVYAYSNKKLQYKEFYNIRGFQSSSEPMVHFGFGQTTTIDSIRIVWPNQTSQLLEKVATNQTLTILPQNTKPYQIRDFNTDSERIFEKDSTNLGLNFVHLEDDYLDFTRQKLMPYSQADRGPAVAIGDLNGDGKDDIFFGGSKYKPSKIYVQNEAGYQFKEKDSVYKDSINEEITAIISDFNGDGKNDLLTGTGGGDFFGETEPLLDHVYYGSDSGYKSENIPNLYENASVFAPYDFDQDGDLDVFVGNSIVTGDFGKSPDSYILINNNGTLEYSEKFAFKSLGMVTDAIWTDLNGDGFNDLLVVGEWMSPKAFINNKTNFKETKIADKRLNGLWRTAIEFDIDQDGDNDYLLGNWGLNSKFKANDDRPLKMWYGDFGKNGQTETIVANEVNGTYYPVANLDALGSNIVSLRKKFTTYKSFAGKSVEEIFDEKILKDSEVLEVNVLASGYLKNDNGSFTFVSFPDDLQVAPITSFLKFDFNNDGKQEVLAAGNYFGVTPYQGRFDSYLGSLIYSDKKIESADKLGLRFFNKSARHLNIIKNNEKPYLMATFNNDSLEVYKLKNYK
ncbi:Repeat domain-containing protein [Flavobacteriaceae bacterium MAR_2010_188]|nr:Repeat domain-containing protein [Flavobacteriaceae bacterium MAR_2010_188]